MRCNDDYPISAYKLCEASYDFIDEKDSFLEFFEPEDSQSIGIDSKLLIIVFSLLIHINLSSSFLIMNKMERKQEKDNPNFNYLAKFYVLLKGAVYGGVVSLISLPFQHPFDTIKTWMQLNDQSTLKSIKEIKQLKGMKGFYSGFSVNSLRVAIRQFYRWPLNIYLISTFKEHFGVRYQLSPGQIGVMAGISIALIESLIVCPFERLKVYLMTSKSYISPREFFQKLPLRRLFDGLNSVVFRQLVSWITYLGSQQYFKDLAYRLTNKDQSTAELNFYEIYCVSLLVCATNIFFVMPIDYVKTHFQKYGNIQNQRLMLKFIKTKFNEHGLYGFYRGSTVRLIQYNIQSFFTVSLIEKLLRQYQKA